MDRDKSIENMDGRIHVLFVDDEPSILKIAKMFLEQTGYIVTSAYDGGEAIEKIKESQYPIDVVVTDYAMPRINGIELALAVKKYLKNTPVILYTGKNEFIDKKQIDDAGIISTISKPCKFDRLDSIIRELMTGR